MSKHLEAPLPPGLHAYQRDVFQLIFQREPDEALAATLPGGAGRWLMYRRMVRKRLTRVIRDALPRWVQVAGDEQVEEAITSFLAARGVDSRFFRDVPLCFADALGESLDDEAKAALTLDRAIWEARNDASSLPRFAPFDFNAPVLLHPAVQVLRTTRHPGNDEHFDNARVVCVYRDVVTDSARWLLLEERAGALLEAWATTEEPAVTAARTIAERFGMPVDSVFAQWLGGCAEDWIERGIVLGAATS